MQIAVKAFNDEIRYSLEVLSLLIQSYHIIRSMFQNIYKIDIQGVPFRIFHHCWEVG